VHPTLHPILCPNRPLFSILNLRQTSSSLLFDGSIRQIKSATARHGELRSLTLHKTRVNFVISQPVAYKISV
jgi:hypothetical protein